tara:strand:+ start:775 stop:987 length:213 start_codon:yes stop_codon:yes gene_type:complete
LEIRAMNHRQRKELDKAFDIIVELKFEQEEKQGNLENAMMDHLPVFEKVVEEMDMLEEIECLISDLQEVA